MLVNSSGQWRIEIENFYRSLSNDRCDYIFYLKKKVFNLYSYVFCRIITAGFSSEFSFHHYFYSLGKFISNIWFCIFSIQVNRDIDLSPEPKPKFCKLFSLLLELK